ncbi:hypothetical protein [Kushneria aurantia]|uniref:Aspartate/glutamate racemase family protein n=2 Tax=Kushneria aurantia TaxID=504092 RepID=A0ABV6FZQ4_9GAMM
MEHPAARDVTLGVIMLNTHFPRLQGDIGNPVGLAHPMIYHRVDSASVPAVVSARMDDSVVEDFVAAGRSLVERGARIVTTSCGFVCAIHDRLQAALPVPLVSSALNLTPWLCDEVTPAESVGILTFDERTLSRAHFGRFQRDNIVIGGMQESETFYPTIRFDHPTWCVASVEREVIAAAVALRRQAPTMKALLLECTNLSPWRAMLAERLGLAVFDLHDAIALVQKRGRF